MIKFNKYTLNLALLTFLTFLSINSDYAAANNLDFTIVAMTPIEQPDMWSASNKNLSELRENVNTAVSSWKSALKTRYNFKTKYVISKPLQNLKRCDLKKDWELAAKIAGSNSNSKVKIIAVNIFGNCPNAGYALLGGNKLSVQRIDSTLLAHEMGHNLGFKHSGYVTCEKNNFKTLVTNCVFEQYGDKKDVMGAAFAEANSKISLAQMNVRFGVPVSLKSKIGLNIFKNTDLVRVETKNGMLFIEFDDATYNGGYKLTTYDQPGLQIRLVNSPFLERFVSKSESGIGTLLLVRNLGMDADGNCPTFCYQDSRLHQGEKINLPFSGYSMEVTKITDSEFRFILSGNL